MSDFCSKTYAAWMRVGHVFAQWKRYQPGDPPDGLKSHLHQAESGKAVGVDDSTDEEPSPKRRGYLQGVYDPVAAHDAVTRAVNDLCDNSGERSRVLDQLRSAAASGFLKTPGAVGFELRDRIIRAVNRAWPM